MRFARPLPNGTERRVGLHELFFSTTDRRGVITAGNSVFLSASHYTAQELIGAPHNIVRHPDMPAGAYRLMWDRLLAGRPMGAYVTNLAKDGSSYRVFATVTPLGDGFLSVRMAPATQLDAAADTLYAATLEQERALSVRGVLGRAEIAAEGAAHLERGLAGLGFTSYDDFMLAALPAEVAARGPLLTTAYARPHAGGPLADILRSAVAVNDELEHLLARLGLYQELISLLGPATDTVMQQARSLQHAVDAARTASAAVADRTPVLLNVARVMGHPMAAAVEALQQLSPELAALRHEVADLGFRIGLGRLHTEMMGAFAAEVIDGAAPISSLAELPRLCDAVQNGVLAMAEAAEQVNGSLATVSTQVHRAGDLLQEFRHFLGQWRILVLRHRQGGAVTDQLGPIDAQLDSMADQLYYLDALAQRCEASIAPVDRTAMEPHLHRVRSVLGRAPV